MVKNQQRTSIAYQVEKGNAYALLMRTQIGIEIVENQKCRTSL